jgi:intracellular sulfur oxidation DsrE/DsrF family protein
MQTNIRARRVHSIRREATALAAAIAVCAAFAFPVQCLAADAAPAKASAGNVSQKQKLVVQVSDNDPKKWNLALNNMKNVQDALGKDKVDIELVAYGPGIDMLKMESTAGNRVSDAVASGIRIVACENTMDGQKLTKADMLKGISYAPAGVIELMRKQKEGYAYIRP